MTPKREKFCQEMLKPKADQSSAYRKAFSTKNMKPKTINEEASRLMKNPEISARIETLRSELEAKLTVTRDQWAKKMEGFYHSDVRKMFTGPGDALDISELGDHEAMMVEGFELVENFTKVGDQAEHTGYTKKVKLTPKLKAMMEFGKVMGWYTEKSKIELGASLEELVMASMKEKE